MKPRVVPIDRIKAYFQKKQLRIHQMLFLGRFGKVGTLLGAVRSTTALIISNQIKNCHALLHRSTRAKPPALGIFSSTFGTCGTFPALNVGGDVIGRSAATIKKNFQDYFGAMMLRLWTSVRI